MSYYYTTIHTSRIKNEITPFDYKIEMVTYKRADLKNGESKFHEAQEIKLTKRGVTYLREELEKIEKEYNTK